ncbi:MAG: ribonuclease E/G [Aquamicrobium sp.]|nr:ribonuclease E/G [Aquamicrobium sp.]
MPNKMLIDASHPEETRVVVVRGNRIEEFDFESQDKKQLKGNIYLARVTRVEPSLQAAFVEYGGNRHGFLAFSEIHPDYYQIPMADRQALLRAEAEEAESEDDEDENEDRGRNRRRRRGGRNRGRATEERKASEDGENQADDSSSQDESAEENAGNDDTPRAIAEAVEADSVSKDVERDDRGKSADDDDASNGDNGGNGDDGEVESVGAEDALEEIRERRRPSRRQYKIQEVIKRRQILLVQVVKEERGNKGAALTTYLSLAGRYSVLMPNTARGGGISRKITNAQDRKRLKDVVKDLDVPQGMGVILRTAGESRTKAEIKRDYEYLMRLWDNVRTLTLSSSAPALVYEEGSLIKRSVRDLYNKDIDEILVAGEEGYREAKDFMRMLMPSHAKVVQPYRDTAPIFARNGIEGQLDKMLQPQVTLKSGGYIIINQTEALVAIDVNSGRSTKEHSIEDTALQTNLEAAEEVARQLRLRDLAGLIVIDFIDMEENRNNRAVEKRLKDHLKNDRARIQVGRISHFGLLEMSRQRIRASVLESTMQPCPHCGGAGHVRSESSVALHVVRAIEEFLLKDSRNHITVRTPTSTAIYVLNHKRSTLTELEMRFGLTISVEADEGVRSQHYAIIKGAPAERPEGFMPPAPVVYPDEPEDDDIIDVVDEEEEGEAAAPAEQRNQDENSEGQRKRKRRRRRRGGRDRDRNAEAAGDNAEGEAADADGAAELADEAGTDSEGAAEQTVQADADGEGQSKKRRRGKRGGKRNRRDDEAAAEAGDDAVSVAPEGEAPADVAPEMADQAAMDAVEAAAPAVPVAEAEAAEKPKKKAPRRTSKKAKAEEPEVADAAADLAAPTTDEGAEAAAEKPAKPKAKRTPRRKAAAAEAVAEEAASEVVAEAAPEAPSEPVAPAEMPVVAKVETKPAEPVVTSSTPANDETKPRKGGWWQRKGFF